MGTASTTGAPSSEASAAATTSPGSGSGGGSAAAFVVGFLPWILYWILVGNVPFRTAVLVALGLSVVINVVARVRHEPPMVLEVGTAVVFAVFAVLAFTVSDDTLARWLQPLGNLGLFLIVLASILVGKPFTLQYARQSTPPEMWDEPGFVYVCRLLAWVWVGAMGFMTVVSAIPPVVDGDATIRDAGDPLSIVCYWVLPFAALGLTMLFTIRYPDWFGAAAGGDDDEAAAGPAPVPPLPIDGRDDHTAEGAATLDLTPADVLVDAAADVRVSGVGAGAAVALTAETVDAAGRRWRSASERTAGPDGVVSVGADELIWPMEPSDPAGADIFFPPGTPSATVITAESGGVQLAATLVRRLVPDGVVVTEVRAPGVVGRLFLPPVDSAGAGRLPGVVLFPGSEGGLDSQASNAAVLAAHGCAALVAATFQGDGPPIDDLPASLERVPLERFTDAIGWLAGHDRVDAGRVSAMAISRGSEGLLAALSRAPDLPVACVVAVAPSSTTWVGLGEYGSLQGIPAWTWQGADLPAVQTDDDAVLREIAHAALRRRGRTGLGPMLLHLTRAYAPRLSDADATGAAAIAVEDIAAPLVLVTGTDDQVWPSTEMATRIVERRRASPNPHASADTLHTFDAAGHLVRLGCWPTTVGATGGIALGGEPAAMAQAQAALTPIVVTAVAGSR